MEKKIQRILNKSKDGVVISVFGHEQSLTWEEFNSTFVMTEDKRHCHLNNEAAKKYEEGIEMVSQCIAYTMIAERAVEPKTKLTYTVMVGRTLEKIAKCFGCTIAEAMKLVATKRREVEADMSSILGTDNARSRSMWRKKTPIDIENDKKKEREMLTGTVSSATQSMSGVKGMDELKKKFNIQ